jgi:WXXGXW repeat (2 copies)
MNVKPLRITLAAALLSAALSGCIVAPAPGYGYAGETVYSAPPALQVEAVGVAPTPGYFWIGGGWFWEGGRYGWHPGYWSAPRAGYRWVPREWGRAGGGWRARGGYWARR